MNPTSPAVSAARQDIPSNAILALSVGSFGSGMSMRIVDSMLVRLAGDFGVTLGVAAMAITAFGVAYGLSQLLFGPLGDRYGKYLVIAWGCVACAFTALLCGLAPDFSSLLLARMLAGATCASVIPLSMAWIGDVVAYEDRQAVLARFLIGQILGLSTGIMFGGISADYLDWRFPFFLIAASFLVTGIYLVRMNGRLPAHAKAVHKAEGHALARMVGEFRKVLEVPWARKVLGTVLTEGALVYGALAFVPTHLHTVHGRSLATAGLLVMLFGLGGFLFAMRSRSMVRQLGEVGLIRYGAMLMAASMVTVGYSPLWWTAVPACFVFGLGFYMMHNTLQINATQMAPERRGAAVASFASCFFLGQSAGVAAGGALLASVGTSHLLAAAGVGVLLIGGRFARLRAARQA
jgi:predicted MFS family arabinose efflux permease